MVVFGSLVSFFKKKGDWPKVGSLDRTLVTNHIFILEDGNQSIIQNFGHF